MIDKTKPMDLGDIFSNTFKLIGQTFSRNLIIAAAFIIPTGIIMAYTMDYFFSDLMEFVRISTEFTEEEIKAQIISKLISNFILVSIAFIIFLLGHLAALIGVTKISWGSINDIRISLGEAFNKIFSDTYWRSVGQILLMSLALYACVTAGIVIIILGSTSDITILKIIGAFGIIAGILLMLYLIFRWYFAFTAIVCEDKKVIESFSKSSMLVEGEWWRTFGIVILFSILIDFAVSIISTPVYFIAMWDFFSLYFQMLAGDYINENDPEIIFNMLESFGFSIGVVVLVSTLLETLVAPVFNVVYYADLKIRKNDYPELNIADSETGGLLPVE